METQTTTEAKKTQPLILERVLAGEVDVETGAVKLSQEVAPTLLVQALLKRVNELTKEVERVSTPATDKKDA